MYKFGYTGDLNDLPETTSIQKQITYGDYVNTKTDMPIRNAFIIPYDKDLKVFKSKPYMKYMDEDHDFVYIGYASGDWRNQKADYDAVYTFLIDLNFLIRNYRKKSTEDIEKLTKQIEELIDIKDSSN